MATSNMKKKRRMQRRIKRMLPILVGSLAALFGLIFILSITLNKHYLEFDRKMEDVVGVEYGSAYSMPKVQAIYKSTMFPWTKKVAVSCTGSVDTHEFGEYELVYSAEYKGESLNFPQKVVVQDTQAPVIELVSDPENFTKPGEKYVEEGYQATDNYDGDLTDQVVREEGDGIITYTVTDSFGNVGKVVRTINYKDTEAPVITLKEPGEEQTFDVGKDYVEPGYTATDDCDGDVTDQVKVEGEVDGHKVGNYTLVYSVADAHGNEAKVTRTVHVVDREGPVITLEGEGRINVKINTEFSDPGYKAVDGSDGDLTDQVEVQGEVDTTREGTYTLTYTVKDSSGNETRIPRTVVVYDKEIPSTIDPGDKVVYLTFDDGPGKYTEKLLDVLDKYNVKVTFFVTNQYPDYIDMIGEEYRRGHTVALHTYSHDYADLYSSVDAYYKDLNKMSDLCYEQTGVHPTILRFPGGSSNGISKKYCRGIMTELIKSVEANGYQYADWNVTSGDAGETTSTDQVAKNVIEGMKNSKVSVVLQHDIKGFSVDAVETIIKWGLENGYTFLPMQPDSPMKHHGINN